MTEENPNLIQLTDENGVEVNFEHLMTIQHEGSYYILLEAQDGTDDCEAGECIVLKIVHDDENDEDVYEMLDDEEELDTVFNKFMTIMEEEDEATALNMEMLSDEDND